MGRGGRDRKGKEIYDTHTPLNGVEMQPSRVGQLFIQHLWPSGQMQTLLGQGGGLHRHIPTSC